MIKDFNLEVTRMKSILKDYKPKNPLTHEDWEEYYNQLHQFQERIRTKYDEKTLVEIQIASGFQVQDGEYEWVDGIGAIDVHLVPYIKSFNEMGYETVFSCSGIKSEHKKGSVTEGYIAFNGSNEKRNDIYEKAADICDLDIQTITSPRRTLVFLRVRRTYDWQTKRCWKRLLRTLSRFKKHHSF